MMANQMNNISMFLCLIKPSLSFSGDLICDFQGISLILLLNPLMPGGNKKVTHT